MSKRKRGMTLDEKREALLSILRENKEPYNLKELEKLGSKAGVVTQTVKEVLQTLVDDSLIELEKIGSQNFYWAFPSKAMRNLQTRLESLESAIRDDENTIQTLASEQEQLLNAGREASEQRTELLKQYEELKAEKTLLEQKIAQMRENDPDVIKELQQKAETCKTAANRWTDNIWVLKTHVTNKYGIPSEDFDRHLEIPDDFDYVE